jgi:GT2 family glycosyltransferase
MPFGVGNAHFHYSDREEWVDTVYMGAWRRNLFSQIGGFDEEFVRNQDDEFNYRLRSFGGKILLTPLIVSRYFNRSTPTSLFKQYFQYGLYKVRVLQKHPYRMKPRQFAPVSFIVAFGATLTMALLWPTARFAFVTLCSSYLTVSAVASLSAARRHWRLAPVLPVVFFIIHFAYGVGFAVGLVRYAKLWTKESLLGSAPKRVRLNS